MTDIEDWLITAEKKFTELENQLNDPNIDELDKVQVQDDIDMLTEQYIKYKGYGGFTKPKAGKKPKALAKLKLRKATKSSTPKFTTPTIDMSMPKVLNIKSVKLPKISIKKPNYKKSINTIKGATRIA